MPKATLHRLEGDQWQLAGEITLNNVQGLLAQGKEILLGQDSLKLDLSKVVYSDSSGIALLLNLKSIATSLAKNIAFQNIPPKMQSIAKLSHVTELLEDRDAN